MKSSEEFYLYSIGHFFLWREHLEPSRFSPLLKFKRAFQIYFEFLIFAVISCQFIAPLLCLVNAGLVIFPGFSFLFSPGSLFVIGPLNTVPVSLISYSSSDFIASIVTEFYWPSSWLQLIFGILYSIIFEDQSKSDLRKWDFRGISAEIVIIFLLTCAGAAPSGHCHFFSPGRSCTK